MGSTILFWVLASLGSVLLVLIVVDLSARR
jgi:hypothetical protein